MIYRIERFTPATGWYSVAENDRYEEAVIVAKSYSKLPARVVRASNGEVQWGNTLANPVANT